MHTVVCSLQNKITYKFKFQTIAIRGNGKIDTLVKGETGCFIDTFEIRFIQAQDNPPILIKRLIGLSC